MNLFKKNQEPVYSESKTEYTYIINIKIGKKHFPKAMNCVLYETEKRIFIGDIYMNDDKPFSYKKYINKGYGSKMMNMLIKFAKENGYEKITGNISEVDDANEYDTEHLKRLIHFYKKFGFAILPNEENPESIELILS